MIPSPLPPADRGSLAEALGLCSALENPVSDENAVEIATWLLLRPAAFRRQPLAAPVLEQLWSWSADQSRCESFCAWFNQHTKSLGHQHTLIELVRETQLQLSVAVHASLYGEIKVKELVPDLFAIFGPRHAAEETTTACLGNKLRL